MKLAFTQPVPFLEERDKPLTDVYQDNFKTMVRGGTDIEILWLKAGSSEPTYAWTEAYNAVEGVKVCYRAWKAGYEFIKGSPVILKRTDINSECLTLDKS